MSRQVDLSELPSSTAESEIAGMNPPLPKLNLQKVCGKEDGQSSFRGWSLGPMLGNFTTKYV